MEGSRFWVLAPAKNKLPVSPSSGVIAGGISLYVEGTGSKMVVIIGHGSPRPNLLCHVYRLSNEEGLTRGEMSHVSCHLSI
jgi:hypothetical protein